MIEVHTIACDFYSRILIAGMYRWTDQTPWANDSERLPATGCTLAYSRPRPCFPRTGSNSSSPSTSVQKHPDEGLLDGLFARYRNFHPVMVSMAASHSALQNSTAEVVVFVEAAVLDPEASKGSLNRVLELAELRKYLSTDRCLNHNHRLRGRNC